MRPYIPPGMQQQTLQPTQSYRQPVGMLQQSQPTPAATPPETTTPQGDPHHAILVAWRRRHGSTWIRADALHADVRQLIDPKGRTNAVRQKLRQLVATCHELETKSVGNRAKPVAHYRLLGLEG